MISMVLKFVKFKRITDMFLNSEESHLCPSIQLSIPVHTYYVFVHGGSMQHERLSSMCSALCRKSISLHEVCA